MTIEEELKSTINLLFNGPDEQRKAAAIKLGRMRDNRSVDALILACQTDDDPITRIFAIQSLMWIGDTKAIDALIQIAKTEPIKSVKITAIQSFAAFYNERIMEALDQIKNSFDPEVAEAALHTFQLIVKSQSNENKSI